MKWQFKKAPENSSMIRVETNLNRKNKYDHLINSKNTRSPLEEFLNSEASKLPQLNKFNIEDQQDCQSNINNISKNKLIQNNSAINNNINKNSERESIKGLVIDGYLNENNQPSASPRMKKNSHTKELKNFYKDDNDESYNNVLGDINYQPEHLSSSVFLNYNRDFKEYNLNNQNSLSLKACSLFDKNKLFENDFCEVFCETKKIVTRTSWEITLLITFIPKQSNLSISTKLVTYDAVEALPNYINDFSFNGPVGQSFNLKMIGVFKPVDFPSLQIVLYNDRTRSLIFKQNIPLPFTINKFVNSVSIDNQALIEYVQESQEICSEEFTIDDNYLLRASDFVEVLPNLVVYDEYLYCMFLNFGVDIYAAVKIEIIDTLDVRVTLYSHNTNSIFYDYIKWFLWMFKN